jgi:hypothetical protein
VLEDRQRNQGSGEDVVPLILRELQDKPSLLVLALPEITGKNLTPPRTEDGFLKWNVDAQIDAWLRWGRRRDRRIPQRVFHE